MALLDRSFALFDDAARKLKVVRMSEIHSESEMIIQLSPYTEAVRDEDAKIAMSSEPEPILRRVPLAGGEHLYLWRAPWCMYHPPSKCWIAILDSDKRDSIPGEYLYHTDYLHSSSSQAEYISLRKTMMATVESLERQRRFSPIASAPPACSSRKPPTFVGAIMKRDAIANGMACPISLEDITEKMKLGITPCFHLFEADSLMQWVGAKEFCPACLCALTEEDCLIL